MDVPEVRLLPFGSRGEKEKKRKGEKKITRQQTWRFLKSYSTFP